MRRDFATVMDFVEAGRLIGTFVAGIDRTALDSDLKTQSAVMHQLMIIGEATKRLSREFRESVSGAPWAEIAGMRDRLIHGYDIVDIDEVWKTATLDVPDLISRLESHLPKEP
jgi:uncharacterized protein with HEPN domain